MTTSMYLAGFMALLTFAALVLWVRVSTGEPQAVWFFCNILNVC